MAKSGLKSKAGSTSSRMSGRQRPGDKVANARVRMAKRARRARFFKENKKRIGYGVVLFILLMFAAFFTPLGPDWYYGKLQQNRMASASTVGTGYFEGLYKLGRFYQYTFRKDKAEECYNEIGAMFYGFTFSNFGTDPTGSMERRFESERQKAKGQIEGPPFAASERDLPYVGFAMHRVAEFFDADNRRGFGRNLVVDLYLNDFCQEHPFACPAEFTAEMRRYGDFLAGK